jgi:hypothetical protein
MRIIAKMFFRKINANILKNRGACAHGKFDFLKKLFDGGSNHWRRSA